MAKHKLPQTTATIVPVLVLVIVIVIASRAPGLPRRSPRLGEAPGSNSERLRGRAHPTHFYETAFSAHPRAEIVIGKWILERKKGSLYTPNCYW